ncbi:MAG: type II secretion system protein [Candidatus Daviesbacteria bacterium]|nr:type II secretion system protein [Candidatus Daviesbacteria bacterium]
MKNTKGFTLIEILVVIVLLGILGVILTNILSQVLRGQNKINTVNLVKQNGQVILDQLSHEIRSAEKVICIGQATTYLRSSISSYPSGTIVIFRNGNFIRFRLIPPWPVANPTTNGFIQKEIFTIDDIPDATTDEMLCTESMEYTRGQQSFFTNNINSISLNYDGSNPIFSFDTLTPQPGLPNLVLIRFRGFQDVKSKTAESTVSDEGVLFSTAVSVRGGK